MAIAMGVDVEEVSKTDQLCSDKLSEMGPDFGYYPEPRKTILVVDMKDEAEAHALFDELGVSVITGQCFLGGFIGDQEGTHEYGKRKVQTWVHCVEKLSKAAESQPQASHAVLTKSLQFEWPISSEWSLTVLKPSCHCVMPSTRFLCPSCSGRVSRI